MSSLYYGLDGTPGWWTYTPPTNYPAVQTGAPTAADTISFGNSGSQPQFQPGQSVQSGTIGTDFSSVDAMLFSSTSGPWTLVGDHVVASSLYDASESLTIAGNVTTSSFEAPYAVKVTGSLTVQSQMTGGTLFIEPTGTVTLGQNLSAASTTFAFDAGGGKLLAESSTYSYPLYVNFLQVGDVIDFTSLSGLSISEEDAQGITLSGGATPIRLVLNYGLGTALPTGLTTTSDGHGGSLLTIGPPTPPTGISNTSQLGSALKTDSSLLTKLSDSKQANAVANGVQKLDDFITMVTANGNLPGSSNLSIISSANLLLSDTAQFIASPTQANAEVFGKQLGFVVGTVTGAILAAPAAELALATGAPFLAAAIEGAGANIGAVLGYAGANLAINLENAAFSVADGIVSGVGTYQAARATGESPLQALGSALSLESPMHFHL
jgi:hypothetical protein